MSPSGAVPSSATPARGTITSTNISCECRDLHSSTFTQNTNWNTPLPVWQLGLARSLTFQTCWRGAIKVQEVKQELKVVLRVYKLMAGQKLVWLWRDLRPRSARVTENHKSDLSRFLKAPKSLNLHDCSGARYPAEWKIYYKPMA